MDEYDTTMNQGTMQDVRDAKGYTRKIGHRILDQADREGHDLTASEKATFQPVHDEALALEKRVGASRTDPRFGEMHNATITTNPSSGGVLVVPQYLPTIVPVPLRPSVGGDLLGSAPTLSNPITCTAEMAITNAARIARRRMTQLSRTLVLVP